MSTSVYKINKGINTPLEFKGLKAQYIWYLGGGLLALLIFFSLLFICGVNTFVCLFIIIVFASLLFVQVYRMSRRYGEHGMMKTLAKRSVPKMMKCYSRKVFTGLVK